MPALIRFSIVVAFLFVMVGVPIKMYLRWGFRQVHRVHPRVLHQHLRKGSGADIPVCRAGKNACPPLMSHGLRSTQTEFNRLGQPTPEGVPKQDVHITDLPPEVRKSFLMSMVFFPSMIGAAICAIMFLGWITIFRPKDATQYAAELGSPDMRRRWTAAREMGEHITQYGEEKFTKIYGPETLTALIDI